MTATTAMTVLMAAALTKTAAGQYMQPLKRQGL
jgi:hypothetical protein